jgi:hypothetical protein
MSVQWTEAPLRPVHLFDPIWNEMLSSLQTCFPRSGKMYSALRKAVGKFRDRFELKRTVSFQKTKDADRDGCSMDASKVLSGEPPHSNPSSQSPGVAMAPH